MKIHSLHARKLLGWLSFQSATADFRGHEGEVAVVSLKFRGRGAGTARIHDQTRDEWVLPVGEGIVVD